MTCPSCQHENPPENKFCGGCGAALGQAGASPSQAAASSTRPITPDLRAYTPKHLADKILTTRSALEGERKLVTVLFADVSGSMDLAEQVDPEVWHRIMNRFFEILGDGVHRFEGTVNQFTGDGIMALFGAPIAHEDHAQRACYAALHLRDDLRRYAGELRRTEGLNFSVRMGLNSGEVIVGKIGDDLRMDYTAQGHTVGLAARMENLAEPGHAYLTEATAALVSGYFQVRDLGPFGIKGVRDPVRVFELEGVGRMRTRLDVSRARGFSRFVGRAKEMEVLEAALARALEGEGQVVGVVADAGTGKSRLCHELVERCRARRIWVRESHCVPHGKSIPLLPVLENFRNFFDVTEGDADRTTREKIAGRMLMLDEALVDDVPIFCDFLGVPDPEMPLPPMDPEARQRRFFQATKRLMQALSKREPAVNLMEDLHWIDGASDAFLETMVDAAANTRTLILLTFRPEYRARWMDRPYYQQLSLLPLTGEATDEMLRDLLGTDPSLAKLAEQIGRRTAGNPFFMEEAVRSLVDSGNLSGTRGAHRLERPVDEVAIPTTVQAVLTARIDRLPEDEKRLLQDAAVIGKEFPERLLRKIAAIRDEAIEPALQALAEAEFIHATSLYPEAEYAFNHPLTQEVAYRSRLAEPRERVHAALARAIEELHPDKLDEKAALLAHHWEAAGDRLEAARWSCRAALWTGVRDMLEAGRHWRKVRELTGDDPDTLEAIYLGRTARAQLLSLGLRVGLEEGEADALYQEGRALASKPTDHPIGDKRFLALLLAAYSGVKGLSGDLRAAIAVSEEAFRLADELEDQGLLLDLAVGLVYVYTNVGRFEEALRIAERTLAGSAANPGLGSGVLGFNSYCWLVWYRAVILVDLGRFDEATKGLDEAMQLAREKGELEVRAWAYGTMSYLARLRGDMAGALQNGRAAVELAEKIGSPLSVAVALWPLGQAHLEAGDPAQAAEILEQAIAVAREKRTGLQIEPSLLVHLAEARMELGHLAEAQALAERALETSKRQGYFWEADADVILARVLMRAESAGAANRVETLLERAQSLVTNSGARSRDPMLRLQWAELARLRGDIPAQRTALQEARAMYADLGCEAQALKVDALLEKG